MKYLKMIPAITVVLILLILAGCSDQITSSGNSSEPQFKGRKSSESTVEENIPVPITPGVLEYKEVFKLKPNGTHTFSESNTGFVKLNSFDIQSIYSDPFKDDVLTYDCKDILVFSTMEDKDGLGCHRTGLNLDQITVKNVSSKLITVSVKISGVKRKKIIPVVNE